MNSEAQADQLGESSPGSGLAFGDILYTIFRHKFLIVCSLVLGLGAAVVVRFIRPPNFESTAQIYVPYIIEQPALDPSNPNNPILSTGGGGEMQMYTEVDFLRSFDTALEVADKIGPARILARYGGGAGRMDAAGVIASGISILPPRTMSLTVTFSHRDPLLVQPVMQAIVEVYMRRHRNMRLGVNDDNYFAEKREETKEKLTNLEDQIRRLKVVAGVPDLRERQNAVTREYADLQTQVLRAESELSRRSARLGELSQSQTNLQATAISSDTIATYSDILTLVDGIKREQRSGLMLQDWTTNHPSYLKLEVKLQKQLQLKSNLEAQYPTLTNYITALPRTGGTSNSVPRLDLESDMAALKELERTLRADKIMLTNLTLEAFRLMEMVPQLTELERQRDAARKDYEFYQNSLDRAKLDDAGSGKVINIKSLQSPTPPVMNKKKLLKLAGIAFGAFAGLGFGIAFLFDIVVDRSIRRPAQIMRALKLPVILTVPDLDKKPPSFLPWTRRNSDLKIMRPDKKLKGETPSQAVAPWSPDNKLQSHIEGLRERVITHFDVKGLEHHPKLVALTACTPGSGVSTLASGLAASLSRTGRGSVLLVDLNAGEGVTHAFYKGKPGYGPSESFDPEIEPEEAVAETPDGDNLALAKIAGHQSKRNRLEGILPPSFSELSPKLKADAYDYVVFDMTCITPASVTPRMSARMDLVLFVIESEKTKDHQARYACGLLRESRANVSVVLNKYYNPVPAWLAQD